MIKKSAPFVHHNLFNLQFILFLALAAFGLTPQKAQSQELIREARIQSFMQNSKNSKDIFDKAIRSPKSALFSMDGRKLYVNSLEGYQTVVYKWPSLEKIKSITHSFGYRNQNLFKNDETTVFDYPYFQNTQKKNYFNGKPVEMTLSHEGRFLWVTYYRREYDSSAQSPSAIAIIDTAADQIVRVMPTGPIPKFVSASPDGRYLAVTHWGDNTIGLIDISSSNPFDFNYVDHLVVENKLSQTDLAETDRDTTCGFCLRGTIFTGDSRFLIVARMGGGGLAAFDLAQKRYLGTLLNIKPTPRHLVLSHDQKTLIVSSNQSGYVTFLNVEQFIKDLFQANGRRIQGTKGKEVFVGLGARTIELDPTGQTLYAAVNNDIKLVAIEVSSGQIKSSTTIDPYPVGLAVSRDGQHVVVTSQGHSGRGGNAVNIIRVEK
jgi:DNA-binding beta-propeller fold protein YncE